MDLSEGTLRQALRSCLQDRTVWASISEHGRLTCANFQLACCVILQTMGKEWSMKQIGRMGKVADYFKADTENQESLVRFMLRATELGELIYNLQGVGGFDERLSSIRTGESHDVESGIAELFAGKFFKSVDVAFQEVLSRVVDEEFIRRRPLA